MAKGKNQRKVYQNCVVSDKTDKAIIIAVETKKNHLICGKRTNCSREYRVHGESNTAKVGDIARVMEARPLLATERFRLSEVAEEVVII